MSTSTIPVSRARKELFDIIERVQRPTTPYVRLTVKGEGKAIIMSEDEWESWKETVAIMSDPQAMEDIRIAREEVERGEYYTLDELKQKGWFVQESKAKYGTQKHTERKKTPKPKAAKERGAKSKQKRPKK
ncbi:MAG: type II toxin-antitoxin system Phd/YefM family antitoxin [Candidatus Uhrbacteria bacterium]